MTDKETLFSYRLKEAEDTLQDAERMLQGDYKELVELSVEDVTEHVNLAKEFLKSIKDFILK